MSSTTSHTATTKRLRFVGAKGFELAGIMDLPAAEVKYYSIFAHPFTSSKDLRAISRISKFLAKAGIAVLRFDFTGLGMSKGEFVDTNFTTNVEDILAAAAFLREEYAPPELLIGLSLGGAACLKAATRLETCRAVVTLNAPSDTQHILKHFKGALQEIFEKGAAKVSVAGRVYTFNRQFVEDFQAHEILNCVERLGVPLLLFHAIDDDTVPIAHAERIFSTKPGEKALIALENSDHLLTDEATCKRLSQLIAAWLQGLAI